VAQKAALDFEEMLIKGDTSISSSTDDLLCLQDGILKRFTSNVVDVAGSPFTLDIANRIKKAIPTRYRRNLAQMGIFLSMDKESDYRVVVAGRGTPLGDAVATGGQPVPVLGVPLIPAALMPEANAVFTDPKNIVWGLQRNLRIETDKDIRAREFIFVLTARVAIQVEEEVAGAKTINLG
jgi:Phage capsid family